MASIPLSWQLSIHGAEQVKGKLNELQSSFQKGEISAEDFARGVREVNRDARTFVNIGNTQKNIILATSPGLNLLTRATSGLASISRTYLGILNAINLARIAGQGLSSNELELNSKISDIMRKLAKETNPEKIGKLNEELSVLTAQLKELGDQRTQQNLEGIGLAFLGIVIAVEKVVRFIPQIKAFAGLLSSAVFAENIAVLLAGAARIGLAFAGIGAAMAVLGGFIADFLVSLFGLDEWRKNNGRLLEEFFTQTIPQALTATGLWFASIFTQTIPGALGILLGWFERIFNSIGTVVQNAMIFLKDSVTSFFNEIVRQIVNFVNFVNSIIFKKGSKTTSSSFSGMQGSAVSNALHAANGFEGMITKPTLFLAGESGSEHISITPHGKSPSGQAVIIHNHIQGSVISERQLYEITDRYFKEALKRRGFTGV